MNTAEVINTVPSRPILSMKPKTQDAVKTQNRRSSLKEIIESLKPDQLKEFEEDLFIICVAHYLTKAKQINRADYNRAVTRAKSKYLFGNRKKLSGYLQRIDDEVVDLISSDLIHHYSKSH